VYIGIVVSGLMKIAFEQRKARHASGAPFAVWGTGASPSPARHHLLRLISTILRTSVVKARHAMMIRIVVSTLISITPLCSQNSGFPALLQRLSRKRRAAAVNAPSPP
jgi:hypothetical protein